ncbi:MAG TPA: hypothetical protein VHE79_08855, partial [Spirochaetia bacterium]
MKKTTLLLVTFLCLSAITTSALSATLKSVEEDIVLRTDGKAVFWESLDWAASGGQMHGFYLEGTAVTPVFNPDQCYADLPGGTRVGLSITKVGSNRYDVVLAGGRGFSGDAMYFLNYGGDLAASGHIGWTTSADYGELFYFDWAPEEWEYPMEHRTMRIELPIEVTGEKVADDFLAKIGFRTEPYVNDQNGIDAYGSRGDDGKYYLTLRFHQTDLGERQTQRLQFYISKSAIPMAGAALG